jgi:hypothetical protein
MTKTKLMIYFEFSKIDTCLCLGFYEHKPYQRYSGNLKSDLQCVPILAWMDCVAPSAGKISYIYIDIFSSSNL